MTIKFSINSEKISATHPFESTSTVEMFNENLLQSFSDEMSKGDLLPPGLLYVSEDSRTIVFERPPFYQNITYVAASKADAQLYLNENQRVYKYTIPIPWQVYIAQYNDNGTLSSLKMYFTTSNIVDINVVNESYIQLSSKTFQGRLTEKMYICALPNMYEEHNFCLDQDIEYNNLVSIGSRISKAYAAVWETVFNADLLDLVNNTISSNHDKIYSAYKESPDDVIDYLRIWSGLSITDLLSSMVLFTRMNAEVHVTSDHLNNTKIINAINCLI